VRVSARVAVDMDKLDIHGYIHGYIHVWISDIGCPMDVCMDMRPSDFWKLSRVGRLTICAKIIFSVPVSSLSSQQALKDFIIEAGMLLTKQRKRMSPVVGLMKKLVYIRYEKKYRKWMKRLGISISEEELKKGIEEDGADVYEDEVQDEDLADNKVTLSLTLRLFHFLDFLC